MLTYQKEEEIPLFGYLNLDLDLDLDLDLRLIKYIF